MRVAPIRAQALVAVPSNAKAIHNYNPPEPVGVTTPSARNWFARPALFRQADAYCSPSPRPRPAAALAPHAGGGPLLSSPSTTDLSVNMAFLETSSRPQPDPATAQDWYALQAMHPASARTISRTYATLEAALKWGVALMRRGYYIEIWSPSFLEDRRDALLD